MTARLAEAAVRYFLPYAPNGALVALDWRISGFAFLLITAGGLASGIYPAWRAARVRPLEAIRSEGE